MSMEEEITGLRLLYYKCLQDLKYGEKIVIKCATALSLLAHTEALQRQLLEQARTAEQHGNRLDEAFLLLETTGEEGRCPVIEMLAGRAGELVKNFDTGSAIRDAAIVYTIQLISHYKIAGYTNMIGLLRHQQQAQVLDLLQLSLKEERQAELQIGVLAHEIIHPAAHRET